MKALKLAFGAIDLRLTGEHVFPEVHPVGDILSSASAPGSRSPPR
jgi:hypothetical protein